jgi:hypothetical protein
VSNKIKSPEGAFVRKIRIEESDLGDYPIFCFKHFLKSSADNCTKKQLLDFIERLQKLSVLGWREIRTSSRHGFGSEKIAINELKVSIPSITPDMRYVLSFRYGDNNLPFIAIRHNGNSVLHILAIEARHGDIYNHGRK